MPEAAPCGLRIAHSPHPMCGGRCPGKPWPKHHEPRHLERRGYRPEVKWSEDPEPRVAKHRRPGPPVLADEPEQNRSRPRLGWHDKEME